MNGVARYHGTGDAPDSLVVIILHTLGSNINSGTDSSIMLSSWKQKRIFHFSVSDGITHII